MNYKSRLEQWIENFWYQRTWCSILLIPLSKLIYFLTKPQLNTTIFPKPIIVIGNIIVGGVGKTPLIYYIAKLLTERKISYGIIAKGYGGSLARNGVIKVNALHTPAEIGDEPYWLFHKLNCPVIVSHDRFKAAEMLLDEPIQVILSDDGLQHGNLPRALEVAVIDSERGFGNGLMLPLGPLRELPERLNKCDLVVVNGKTTNNSYYEMQFKPKALRNVLDNSCVTFEYFYDMTVNALCGIGNPGRFFHTLLDLGLHFKTHIFPDHHPYTSLDLQNIEGPIITTSKDAVKLKFLNRPDIWALEIEPQLNPLFAARFYSLLQEKLSGIK